MSNEVVRIHRVKRAKRIAPRRGYSVRAISHRCPILEQVTEPDGMPLRLAIKLPDGLTMTQV